MNKKNSLTDLITDAEPITTPETQPQRRSRKEPTPKQELRRVRKKPRKPRKRYWLTLDPDTHATAKQRVAEGYAPDDHFSPVVNRLIDNWIAGHYDDVHDELGWFD